MDNNTTTNGTSNFNVADSRDSSPPRDADNNGNHFNNSNNSFIDEPPPPSSAAATATFKVKFMCSYGGRIQPRPHDNQLTYIGGDTKIVAVDRHVKFSALSSKLCSIANADVCFKYQLPGEDLDALISVTNDEDLDHMMVEYDRLCRSSPRPARLRLILFPLPTTTTTTTTTATTTNNAPLPPHPSVLTKSERQWFVDALNSVRIPEPSSSSPTQLPHPSFASLNPDFLFGLDNHKPNHAVSMDPAPSAPTVPDFSIGSSENAPEAVGETEFVRHVQEMQRLHLGNNNSSSNNNTTSDQPPQPQRKSTEENGVANGVEYYAQKNQEKPPNSGPVHVNGPVPVPVNGSFLHNPVGHSDGYSLPVSGTGVEPAPVYLIQTPSGIYHAIRPMAGPVGSSPVYLIQTPPASVSHVPASVSHAPAQNNGGYGGSEVGSAAERGYSQVTFAVRPQAASAPNGDRWN